MGGREIFGRPMVLVNEMIRVQPGDEEVTAQWTILEQQAEAEARAREERTVEQFLEAQARYEKDLSQQARAAVQQHTLQEKACYEARFHHLEANLQHRQALRNHNLEEKAIAQSRRLHQQLEESEQHYKTAIQREAENFANNLQKELQYHMTSNGQSQSLLSAERDKFRQEYDAQAEKWSHYSEITQQAEEALQGLTDEHNTIEKEPAQAQNDLFDWTEWYQEGFPPRTQAEEDGMGPEEIKEFFQHLTRMNHRLLHWPLLCSKMFFHLITFLRLLCPVLEQECLATFPPTVLLTLGLPKLGSQIAMPIWDPNCRRSFNRIVQGKRKNFWHT